MWIRKKTFIELEKRVLELEKKQIQANNMVKTYIEDSETLSNMLTQQLKEFPKIIKTLLDNNSGDK